MCECEFLGKGTQGSHTASGPESDESPKYPLANLVGCCPLPYPGFLDEANLGS